MSYSTVKSQKDTPDVKTLLDKIESLENDLRKRDEAVQESNERIREACGFCKDFIHKFKEKTDNDREQGNPHLPDEKSDNTGEKENHPLNQSENDYQQKIQQLEEKLQQQNEVLKQCTDQYMERVEEVTLKADELKLQNERLLELQQVKDANKMLREIEYYQKQTAVLREDLKSVNAKRAELIQKLSQEWSQKVASSESDIENISMKNRPMNVAFEYETLMSQEWLDTKSSMDTCGDFNEEGKLKTLSKTLLKAEELARRKQKDVMKSVVRSMTLPLMTIFTSPFVTTKSRSTQRETDDTVSMNTLQGLYVTVPGQPQEDMDTEETNPYKDHNGVQQIEQTTPASFPGISPSQVTSTDSNVSSTLSPGVQQTEGQLACGLEADVPEGQYLKQTHWIMATGQIDINGVAIPDHLERVLHNTVGDILRVNGDDIVLASLEKVVYDFMTEQLSKSEPPICCEDVFMKKYVKGCCRLCWKMVIQRPTMEFTCSGINEKWDPKTQEVAFGAIDPEGKDVVVSYYVQPTLHHVDKLMVKGKIMTKLHQK